MTNNLKIQKIITTYQRLKQILEHADFPPLWYASCSLLSRHDKPSNGDGIPHDKPSEKQSKSHQLHELFSPLRVTKQPKNKKTIAWLYKFNSFSAKPYIIITTRKASSLSAVAETF